MLVKLKRGDREPRRKQQNNRWQRSDDGKAELNRCGQPVSVRYLCHKAAAAALSLILHSLGVDDQSLRIKQCASVGETLAIYEQPPGMVPEAGQPRPGRLAARAARSGGGRVH